MSKDARSLRPDAQAALRQRAVRAVVTGGRTQVDVVAAFGVTRQAVGKWMKAYRERGKAALAARKRGPKGGAGKLRPWQAATICNLIRDRHPEQLKLPFALWTSDAVRQLIRRRFGVAVSGRSVRRWLQRWGFTPQKPQRVAYERDPESVRQWLEEEYPAIRRRSKREKARLYWGDEMGVRSDHQAGRSWAPKGRTPVIPGTGQRFGANVLSAITHRGHLDFMVFKGRFNTSVFLRFLRRLVRQAKRKVFLIVDDHPVHRGRAVQRWLASHADRIEMFFLPGYSPDMKNPSVMPPRKTCARAQTQSWPRQEAQRKAIVPCGEYGQILALRNSGGGPESGPRGKGRSCSILQLEAK